MIRVWGEGAIEAVGLGFRPYTATPLDQHVSGRLRVGRMGAGLGDEVVVAVLKAEVPAVEIQCHGGMAAAVSVLDSLERQAYGQAAAGKSLGLITRATTRSRPRH